MVSKHPEPPRQEQKEASDGGLYKNLNVPMKTLNLIIIGCIAVMIGLVYLGTRNGGFQVEYNSKGGSDVPTQTYQYMDPLELPEPPTREGWTFDGWYLDENFQIPVQEGMSVEQSMTLYADWAQ